MANNFEYSINETPKPIKKLTGISKILTITKNGLNGVIDNPSDKLIEAVKDATLNNKEVSFYTDGKGGLITKLYIDDKDIIQ
ncbi:MAG: hypothetical protein WCK78_16690 [Paludibacter sp.]